MRCKALLTLFLRWCILDFKRVFPTFEFHNVSVFDQKCHFRKSFMWQIGSWWLLLNLTLASAWQPKLYIPSTLKYWLSTVVHTIDCVCSKIWFKSWVIIFTFQVFWVKKHSKLTWKFLPETSPFFVCPNGFGEHLFSNVYSTWDV